MPLSSSTEREWQAIASNARPWTILCTDGRIFQCQAPSERDAIRVLKEERPGVGVLETAYGWMPGKLPCTRYTFQNRKENGNA